jgi:hypothetical protein
MSQIQQKQQQQHLSIAPLLPIIFTAIALFLAINGPRDWIYLWNQLYNPPTDARHAIRAGTGRPSKLSSQIRIQQLKEHAMGIAKALDDNVRNEKSRLALVRKIYNGIGLDNEMARKVDFWLQFLDMTEFRWPIYSPV